MRTLSSKNYKSKNKKDLEEEKDLYPALHNKINQNNIIDYFVFDENENNIIQNPKDNKNKNRNNILKEESEKENEQEKKIKVDYNVNSFITSSFRPDLYSPYGIISGNRYKLRMAPDKSSKKIEEEEDEEEVEEKPEKKEEDKASSLSISDKENTGEIKKIKLNRYFNIAPDITIKCHLCGQIGHIKDVCPNYDIKFCTKCLSNSHDDRDCDQKKCFRCNKLGHSSYNCQLKDSQIILCERCHYTGHTKNECLIKPMEFSHKFLKYNNLSCIICGSKKHVLCSLAQRELPIFHKEEESEEKDIFNDENLLMNLLFINNNNINSDDDGSSLTPLNEEVEEADKKKDEENLDKEKGNEKKKKKKKKKAKSIFEDLKDEEIKDTMFCGFCGNRHRNEECKEIKDEKFNNKFDEQRKNIGKRIFEKRRKEEERGNEREKEDKFSSFKKRNRDKDYFDKSFKQNQETRYNKKYKNKFKDKSKSKSKSNSNNKYINNKSMPLNEDDDLSKNENNYNSKNSKQKSNRNFNKWENTKYKNKDIKVSNFLNK